MDMRLELVPVPVTDVDRAKAFYVDQVGFNLDHDHKVRDDLRFVQLTPPEAVRRELNGRGVETTDVQDFPWGRFIFFSDPDGNSWSVQQIQPQA